MMHDKYQRLEEQDRILREVATRITQEDKVGWPTTMMTGSLAALAVLLVSYLTLNGCAPV
jgi:hypothetical protein